MSIRSAWNLTDDEEVSCIACGTTVASDEAREYDRYGDRWDREDKRFEHLCKPCHREYSHQPREGLETTLVEVGAGTVNRETFLRRYCDVAQEDESGGAGASR